MQFALFKFLKWFDMDLETTRENWRSFIDPNRALKYAQRIR